MDTTSAPHPLLEYLSSGLKILSGGTAVAFLTWLLRRRRERAETVKTEKEAASIERKEDREDANTIMDLIRDARAQLVEAQRLVQERNHFERLAVIWEDRAKEFSEENETLKVKVQLLERNLEMKTRVNPELPPLSDQ